MSLYFYITVFILSFFVLAKSSDFLVRSLTGLARLFNISEYMVAFIFMSMATSIPELFVGLSAAVKNVPELSLGTVLGSNLVNITLVLGITVILGKGLVVDSKISRRNFWLIFALSFFPLLLGVDGVISRGDGALLILLFIYYITQLTREREYFSKKVNHFPRKKIISETLSHLLFLFVGVGLLIISSFAVVWSGEVIAERTVLSVLSLGLIFVAIGTSIPEIAFGVRARLLGHDSMAVGNSLGSNAFNATLIVGLVSLINPITVSVSFSLIFAVLFLALAFILFNFFVYSKSIISVWEGFVLVFVYVVFLIFEYFGYFV